jgi:hypothetical protein
MSPSVHVAGVVVYVLVMLGIGYWCMRRTKMPLVSCVTKPPEDALLQMAFGSRDRVMEEGEPSTREGGPLILRA